MDTILLLMEKAQDRRLLEAHLRTRYQLIFPDAAAGLDAAFDLCIVDGPALNHYRAALTARKAAEDASYLPVLLVTAKREVSMLTGGIWQIIDEVITSPILKAELHARVEVLLRARRLSLELLACKNDQLQQSERQLQSSEAQRVAILQESEERFRSLFENNHAVMLILDPATGAIVDANAAACAFYGWPHATLTQMNIAQINTLPPDEIRAEIARAHTYRRNHFEFRHCLASGDIREVEVYSGPIQLRARDLLYSLVFDVTERKALEAQLQQAQKMESVGRLAGGVAHDFNNMLAVILLQTELAQMKLEAGSPLADRLREIRKAAERSASLTRQLLAFARKQTIDPQVIDLNQTVSDMLKLLHRLIGEDIELAWAPGRPLWPVKLDSTQADQILTNLCVNARDAIAGVGKITIETANVTIDPRYCAAHPDAIPGDFVMLAVSDNGRGMDAALVSHIFEPFFTTKQVGEGTGLGLSTVYGIARQNGGFINVYSEVGRGSTFKIYLPRFVGAGNQIRAEDAAPLAQGEGETILLVEDERAIMTVGAAMLSDLGYAVLAATTPGEALRLADAYAGQIALLITDVVMPEMNGWELAQSVQQRCPGLRVIFMSGYTANVVIDRGGLGAGVDFIQKPFAIKDLAAKVRAALGAAEIPLQIS
jgi:two-component system cell cycle sensor histidine kinase/response regulator CckA